MPGLPTPADMPKMYRDNQQTAVVHRFDEGEDAELHSFDRCRCGATMVQVLGCRCGNGCGYQWLVVHGHLTIEDVTDG